MKLGIMGGSFDPIHFGHLVAAEQAREQLGLSRVAFVPAAESPFKVGQRKAPSEVRAHLVQLAIADNSHFDWSDYEIKRPGPSYTIDTIRHFRASHPSTELYFITGADAMLGIARWRGADEIFRLCRPVAVTRPGYSGDRLQCFIDGLPEAWRQRLVVLAVSSLDISSSDIRQRLAEGRSIRYLLPEAVRQYIESSNLYKFQHGHHYT